MTTHLAFLLAASAALTGCTYDSVRMRERSRCGAMPQTQAQACYSRTQDTKAEFEAKRRALKESNAKQDTKPQDERYEKWIP